MVDYLEYTKNYSWKKIKKINERPISTVQKEKLSGQ